MTDGLEYLGRARVQGLALLVIAFLVGVLAGVASERLLALSAHGGPPGPHPAGHRLPYGLGRYDLTAWQRDSIYALIERSGPRTQSLLAEVLPRLREHGDSLRTSIRSVLTPEQRRRFDRESPPPSVRRDLDLPGLGPGGPPPGSPPHDGFGPPDGHEPPHGDGPPPPPR